VVVLAQVGMVMQQLAVLVVAQITLPTQVQELLVRVMLAVTVFRVQQIMVGPVVAVAALAQLDNQPLHLVVMLAPEMVVLD
jgi:exosortase/archaeosortase